MRLGEAMSILPAKFSNLQGIRRFSSSRKARGSLPLTASGEGFLFLVRSGCPEFRSHRNSSRKRGFPVFISLTHSYSSDNPKHDKRSSIKTQLAGVFLNGFRVFGFSDRVGVVRSQVTKAAEFLGYAKVQADTLGMAQVEVSIWFRRKARARVRRCRPPCPP